MNRLISQKLIDKIKKLFTSLWTDASGNVGIDGNLQVNSYIKQKSYELDEDTKLQILPVPLADGFSIYYKRLEKGTFELPASTDSIIDSITGKGVFFARHWCGVLDFKIPGEMNPCILRYFSHIGVYRWLTLWFCINAAVMGFWEMFADDAECAARIYQIVNHNPSFAVIFQAARHFQDV